MALNPSPIPHQVHEIGHILGLNHPNNLATIAGYPLGNNSHHTYLASNAGMAPFASPTLSPSPSLNLGLRLRLNLSLTLSLNLRPARAYA